MSLYKVVAGDLPVLEQLDPRDDAGGGRPCKPAWEIAAALERGVNSVSQHLRRLALRGLVEEAGWRGQAPWWTLTERGARALEEARAIRANDRRSCEPAA